MKFKFRFNLHIMSLAYLCRINVLKIKFWFNLHNMSLAYLCRINVIKFKFWFNLHNMSLAYLCRINVIKFKFRFNLHFLGSRIPGRADGGGRWTTSPSGPTKTGPSSTWESDMMVEDPPPPRNASSKGTSERILTIFAFNFSNSFHIQISPVNVPGSK